MTTATGHERDEAAYQGLDQVLSNTEFETSQQEQAIQSEIDKIQAHEKEIEEKEREIEEFGRDAEEVERRREKTVRQLQLNRDNIESLKHTVTVLDEHLEALNKNYQSASQKTQNTRAEYDAAIAKYTEKWKCFQSTYSAMPKAQELSSKKETLSQIRAEEEALDAEISQLQRTIDAMKSEGWKDTVQWVLKIATVRVETEATLHLLHSTRLAIREHRKSKQQLETTPADLKIMAAEEGEQDMLVETEEDGAKEANSVLTGDCATPMDESTTETATLSEGSLADNNLHTTNRVEATQQEQQMVIERSNSPQPPRSSPNPALSVGKQPPNVPKSPARQGKSSDVFAKPRAPPHRFAIPKPSQKQSQTGKPMPTLNSTDTSTTTTNTVLLSSKSSVIRPTFQIQIPKPPTVPSSPKPSNTTSTSVGGGDGGGKTRFSFELPKFSIPPPSATVPHPQPASNVQTVPAKRAVQASDDQTTPSEISAPCTKTPSLYSKRTGSDDGESTTSMLHPYRLHIPPKPVPPPPPRQPTSVTSLHNPQNPPRKAFAPPQLSLQSAQTQKNDFRADNMPPATTQGSGNSISKVPSIDVNAPTYPRDDHSSSSSDPEQQNGFETQTQTRDYQDHYMYVPHREAHLFRTHDELMEVGAVTGEEGGRGGGGGGEVDDVVSTSFNLADTSIDFGGDDSVDYDGSANLFVTAGDDNMFNMPQTGSLFNTSQAHSGGCVEASTNEDDFFSQFGKTKPSSDIGAGTFLF